MSTFAPCSERSSAVARPMPRAEPVTIATLSSRTPMCRLLGFVIREAAILHRLAVPVRRALLLTLLVLAAAPGAARAAAPDPCPGAHARRRSRRAVRRHGQGPQARADGRGDGRRRAA